MVIFLGQNFIHGMTSPHERPQSYFIHFVQQCLMLPDVFFPFYRGFSKTFFCKFVKALEFVDVGLFLMSSLNAELKNKAMIVP